MTSQGSRHNIVDITKSLDTFIYKFTIVAIMGIAKVTTNYQVTIPKDIRKVKDIQIGDTVFFTLDGNKVDFFKMKRETLIKECAGSWKDKISKDSLTYVKDMRKEWKTRE